MRVLSSCIVAHQIAIYTVYVLACRPRSMAVPLAVRVSKDWAGSKWQPDRGVTPNKHHSDARDFRRVPLLFLTVEKIEHENFDSIVVLLRLLYIFIYFFLSFFISFFHLTLPSCLTQKLQGVYSCKWSAHQTTAVLSGVCLFLVITACELHTCTCIRSVRYGSKHSSWYLFQENG